MTLWLTQSYTYNVSLTHTHTRWWGPFGGRQASDVQSHWESQQCFLDFSHLSTRWISVCPGALASPETCRTSPVGVARWMWKLVMPLKRPCFYFTLDCFKISSLFSGGTWEPEEPEGMASASGISHSPVTLPQLSLPPVKGHGGQWPRWGSGTAGRHALFSSSLLMCGLACFNWHVALQELACRLLVLRC